MFFYRTTLTPCGTAGYGLGMWSQPASLCCLLVIWFSLTILFKSIPEIDKLFSGLFFAASNCIEAVIARTCGHFPFGSIPSLRMLRSILQYLPIIGVIVVIGIMLRDCASGLRWSHERIRISTIALAAFALGPGLLVNGYMKSFIGRPRPADTLLFGGEHAFVAAGEWSQACFYNCSFVSGEAAGMAWIICLLPLWPYRDRHRPIFPMAAIITATALLRVAFGRHYLSDVVLGALSTLVVFSAIACLCEGLTERRERLHKQLAAKAAAL